MNCAAVTITGGQGQDAAQGGASKGSAPQGEHGTATSATDGSAAASTAYAPVASSTYSTDGCLCTCDAPPSPRALQQHRRAGGAHVGSDKGKREAVPWSQRPGMLVADLDNGEGGRTRSRKMARLTRRNGQDA